jgi:hypothetical protein
MTDMFPSWVGKYDATFGRVEPITIYRSESMKLLGLAWALYAAVSANTLGMKRYQAGELARAAENFRDAIAADPQYAQARYNLACVASRLRDVKTAVAQLGWLAKSDDAVAKAKMAKATRDPDLDFVSALPAVRQLFGLPAFDPAAWRDWLTERGGVWSAEVVSPECARRAYTLRFGADGKVSARHEEACGAGAARVRTATGKLESDDALSLAVPGVGLPASSTLELVSCPGLDAPGSCFALVGGGKRVALFHRGLPGLSPIERPAL